MIHQPIWLQKFGPQRQPRNCTQHAQCKQPYCTQTLVKSIDPLANKTCSLLNQVQQQGFHPAYIPPPFISKYHLSSLTTIGEFTWRTHCYSSSIMPCLGTSRPDFYQASDTLSHFWFWNIFYNNTLDDCSILIISLLKPSDT